MSSETGSERVPQKDPSRHSGSRLMELEGMVGHRRGSTWPSPLRRETLSPPRARRSRCPELGVPPVCWATQEAPALPAGKRSSSEDGQETWREGPCPGGPCHPQGAPLRTHRPGHAAAARLPAPPASVCVGTASISAETSQDCKW